MDPPGKERIPTTSSNMDYVGLTLIAQRCYERCGDGDSVDSVEKIKVSGCCSAVWCVDINIKACSNNFLLPQLLSGSAPVNTIIWAKPTRLRKWPHSNSFDLIFMGTNLLNTVTCSTAIYHTCSQPGSPASHFNIPTAKTQIRAEWYFCSGHTSLSSLARVPITQTCLWPGLTSLAGQH